MLGIIRYARQARSALGSQIVFQLPHRILVDRHAAQRRLVSVVRADQQRCVMLIVERRQHGH